MHNFINTTRGSVVVMGRKTFELCRRPLIGRSVCVLTNDANKSYTDALVFTSLESLTKHLIAYTKIYIAGGAEVYKLFEGVYTGFILTQLNDNTKGDIKLPFNPLNSINVGGWSYCMHTNITHGKIYQLRREEL